jgi:hypothetical protein
MKSYFGELTALLVSLQCLSAFGFGVEEVRPAPPVVNFGGVSNGILSTTDRHDILFPEGSWDNIPRLLEGRKYGQVDNFCFSGT